ncbi:DUF805 domain-containing protein [Pleionea sediminis]|uniref:DUF805 domain-containing protein n=1 Tax=Pleionea sediminis TaxID=2569479 RepID=UPI001185E47B|nr:DUF805 domain-containing protein [Pleionea sediminis]
MIKFFYLDIHGRCSRKIYWLIGVLPFIFIGILLGYMSVAFNIQNIELPLYFMLAVTIWPITAMQIKRLHDINLSGWFCLITWVPYVGTVFIILLGIIPSFKHDNKYGKYLFTNKQTQPDK